VQELLSLTDPTQTNPVLPAGHPFIVNLPIDASDVGDWFWTATPYDFGDGSPALRLVSLRNGALPRAGTANAIFKFRVWCVRGGSGNPNQ
jgi:hypothetical protein